MRSTLKQRHWGLIVLAALLAGGCSTVEPRGASLPKTSELQGFPSAKSSPAAQAGTPSALWWTQLQDKQLEALVARAWAENYDLRVAAARFAAARYTATAVQGQRLPQLSAEAGVDHFRPSKVEGIGNSGSRTTVGLQANLDWEFDFFGRVSHAIAAADAAAGERAALLDELRRLIVADVVKTYIRLRSTQMLSQTIREQLKNQDETFNLLRRREQTGALVPAERIRFEAQYRLTSARLPALIAEERASRNRLATLASIPLDDQRLITLDEAVELRLPSTILIDEPMQLLSRRPDVKAAEMALAASAARQGIAYAEMFPRVSFSAVLGTLGRISIPVAGSTLRWGGGSSLFAPIFDGGARRAQWRAAGAEVQAARAHFERSVAVALEETDSAISRWAQARRSFEELQEANRLAIESARLARLRYQEGADSLLAVLEAERTALAAREQLVSAKRDYAIAAADFYVAAAGGLDVP